MKLNERLRLAGEQPSASDDVIDLRGHGTDLLSELKTRAQEAIFSRVGARLYDSTLDEDQLRALVQAELGRALAAEATPLSPSEREALVRSVTDDMVGYGPVQAFLADDTITEVMVNSTDAIYVEQGGHIFRTGARFLSEDHLRRVIERIVSRVGRRIDESSPMVDARLPDGSRVNAIVPPLAVDGPVLTIRKFGRTPLTSDDLVRLGTVSEQVIDFLEACVHGRMSLLVTGGTGTGKTTMLNALSSFIPENERLVTIEDAVELQLHQEHVIRLESRPPNVEGRGEVTIRELVRNALRMRPDRIIVGEVRGGEALDMLQAMNTGHEGSLSTLHANSARDALARLETMVLMAGFDLPVRAIREQVASAIDIVVHVARLEDGTRRVVRVVQVSGMENDTVQLDELFAFDFSAGVDERGRYRGELLPTGLRPTFEDRLAARGITLPAALFEHPGENATASRARARTRSGGAR